MSMVKYLYSNHFAATVESDSECTIVAHNDGERVSAKRENGKREHSANVISVLLSAAEAVVGRMVETCNIRGDTADITISIRGPY